jgi:hypothetical protein
MTIEIGDIVEYIGMRHDRGEDIPVIGYVTDKDKEYAFVQWFIDPRAIEIKQTSNPPKWMHIAYLQKLSEDIDL